MLTSYCKKKQKQKKQTQNRIVSSRSKRLQFMTIGVNLAIKVYVTFMVFMFAKE